MPTRRQLESLMGGYDDFPGYAPPGRSRSLLDLTMEQGRIGAENAYQQGNIWSQALMSAGQQIAGGLQAHQEQKALKKRDAAWIDFIGRGEWSSDPKQAYAESLRIWGPQEGPKQFQALVGVSQLTQPKRDPAADMKALGAVGGAMSKMSDQGRAALWPQAVALTKGAFPELQLPEQYDPKIWAEVEPLLGQMAGGGGEGFTLKPGEQRFGPDGKPLASVPAEVPKPDGPRVVGRSLVGPDGKVIYRDPTEPKEPREEALVPIIGPDGEPVLVPRSQAVGKRPASSREQGRPVTSGDANRLADFDTSLDDLEALKSQIGGATGVRAKVGAALPNVITEMTGIGAEAKSKQATIDRVKQVIGKTLEGGVLRKEDERKYEKILPTIGDPPQVVEAKLRGLEQAIQLRRQTLVESLSDAGYETGRFGAREKGPARPKSKAEFDALPPGTPFIAPDGSRRIK